MRLNGGTPIGDIAAAALAAPLRRRIGWLCVQPYAQAEAAEQVERFLTRHALVK